MILQLINTLLLAGLLGVLIVAMRKPASQPTNHEVLVTSVDGVMDAKPHLLTKPQGDSWVIFDIRLMQSGVAKVVWIREI